MSPSPPKELTSISCICDRSSSTCTFFILSILSQIGGTDEDERTPLSKSAQSVVGRLSETETFVNYT